MGLWFDDRIVPPIGHLRPRERHDPIQGGMGGDGLGELGLNEPIDPGGPAEGPPKAHQDRHRTADIAQGAGPHDQCALFGSSILCLSRVTELGTRDEYRGNTTANRASNGT